MFGVKEINKKEENVCSSEYDNMTEIATDIIRFSKMNNRNNTTIKSDKDYNNPCKSDKMSSSSSKSQNNCLKKDEYRCITLIPTDDGDVEEIYDDDNECFYDQNDKITLNSNNRFNNSKCNNNTDLLQVQSKNIIQKEQEKNKKILHENHQKQNYSSNGEDDDNESNKTDDNDDDDNNGTPVKNENDENYVTDDDDDDDDDDDTSSTDSEFSNLSGLSGISGQDWKPMAKPLNWVQKQINMGANPREILSQILSNGTVISPNLNNMTLWKILASIFSEPPRRQKLSYINTINDVVNLLKTSKNILVLTGAGVSVSCGIPDFRSNNGIYSRLAKDFPDLPDPQAMFDINYFSKDPRPFYKFAREIYPGQFKPSPCHRFIKLLEKKNKLLRNYTQNIDTLEQVAGIKNVIECHGSFATASCTRCKYKTTASVIRDDIFAQRIPKCPKCQIEIESEMNKKINDDNTQNDDDGGYSGDVTEENSNSNSIDRRFINNDDDNIYNIRTSTSSYSELVQNGIMKPDIVFFGEGLPDEFHNAMANDKDECDLLIVIGSSLKVRPVALIPSSIPSDVPQILINREQLNHLEFDVELLGDSDVIINHLCHLLGDGWEEVCWDSNVLKESKYLKPKLPDEDEQKEISDNHYHHNHHHHIRSQTTGTTTALDVDVTADSSSKSASSTLTDGSNSPFCDSGFDSLSSHPGIIEKQQQQKQQQQFDNQHSVIRTFPQIMENDHEKISVFNVNDKKSDLSYSSSTLPSSLSSSSSSSFSLKNNDNNVQINCNINSNSNSSYSNSNFLIKPRNLSIDSSKDSGICDSSNIISISSITNRTNNDNCNSNTCEIYDDDNADNNEHHHYHHKNKQVIENKNCYKNNDDDDNINNDKKDYVLWSNNKHQSTLSPTSSSSSLPSPSISPSSTSTSLPQKPLELRSIADRLYENTYYHHPSKSSYVFPGAQVFWSSDTENEEEDDDKDDDDDYNEQEEGSDECKNNGKIKNNDKKKVNNDDENDDIDDDESDNDNDDDDNDNLENSNSENEADSNDYKMEDNCVKSDFKNDNNSEISSKNYCHQKTSRNDKNNDDNDDDDIPPNKRRKE